MAYGLKGAVVAFNRLPCLLTAMARRMQAVPCGAYVDDIVTIGSCDSAGSGQRSLQHDLKIVPAPVSPGKSYPGCQYRVCLGAAVSTARFAAESVVEIGPKVLTQSTIQDALADACKAGLTPGSAPKLRGRCGWAASLSAGRCGRIGLRVLLDIQ